MTSKLLQKHPIKGSREFQLVDDEIQCTIQSPFKTDSLSVLLAVLEEKPIISDSTLSFKSKVNKEPLVELFLDKPNKEEFDQFVEIIREKIIEHDVGRFRVGDKGVDINIVMLNESIEALQKNVDPTEIKLLLSALDELKIKPDNVEYQSNVVDEFNELGFAQSQVIIHAPYLNFLFCGNG
ncbi:MAG TPA: hypothetical protein EYH38_03380 [Leucothrix sp.]|nr:hypothetical protein [Leucothrix sp.]